MFKRLIAALTALSIAACLAAGASLLYPMKYDVIILINAELRGLPPELVYAVIRAESRFDAGAVSKKEARGLMQLTRTTADWAAEELRLNDYTFDKIHDPELNILIGCWYLWRLHKQFDGVAETALAAYNAGSGNVAKWLLTAENSSDGLTLRYIPFGETRIYVKKVKDNLKIYDLLFALRNLGGVE